MLGAAGTSAPTTAWVWRRAGRQWSSRHCLSLPNARPGVTQRPGVLLARGTDVTHCLMPVTQNQQRANSPGQMWARTGESE